MEANPQPEEEDKVPEGGPENMAGFDNIIKPRTKFTSDALRRAVPTANIKDKLNSMSMN